jgi:xanthine/uracil permease
MLAQFNSEQCIPEFLSFLPVFSRRTETIPLPALANIPLVLFDMFVSQIAAAVDRTFEVASRLISRILIQKFAER